MSTELLSGSFTQKKKVTILANQIVSFQRMLLFLFACSASLIISRKEITKQACLHADHPATSEAQSSMCLQPHRKR